MNLNKYRITSAAAYPENIQLEVSRSCGLSCPQCRRTQTDRASGGSLSPEVLEKMEPVLAQADMLGMCGWGESLTSPMIWKVMEAARRNRVNPCLTTNGVLLTEANCRKLVEHQPGQVTVSLDAGTPEGYRRFRPGVELEEILGKIRLLARIREEMQSTFPMIAITFNFREASAPEFPHFIRLAAGLPILKAAVHPHYPPEVDNSYREYRLSSQARAYFEEGVELARELGVTLEVRLNTILERQLGLPSPESEGQAYLPARDQIERERLFPTCRCAWDFPFVDVEGNVYPCAIYPEPLGNLAEGSFAEVWNNERFIRFRTGMVTQQPTPFCLHCHKTMWYANKLDEPIPEHLPLTAEGLVGLGWYPVEWIKDAGFRWSRGEATVYIRNSGLPMLYLTAFSLREMQVNIVVNDHPLGALRVFPEWGVRTIELPEMDEEILRVSLFCPEAQDDPASYFSWCRLRLLGVAVCQIGTCQRETDAEPQKALQSLFRLS